MVAALTAAAVMYSSITALKLAENAMANGDSRTFTNLDDRGPVGSSALRDMIGDLRPCSILSMTAWRSSSTMPHRLRSAAEIKAISAAQAIAIQL